MRLRPALASLFLPAILGLAACGGSSTDSAADRTASSNPSSEASDTNAADAETQAFCDQITQASAELATQISSASPEALPALLEQAETTLGELDPPADIADSVNQVRATYQQLIDAVSGLDTSTPEGQQAFTEAASSLGLGSTPAETAVDDWTTANCGSAAAPSS